MPIRSDYHIHTNVSADSHTPMEDQIRAAIAAGMESICFTEHVDLDSPYLNTPAGDPESDFRIDYETYREIFLLHKIRYAGRIRLFFGLELGLNTAYASEIRQYLSGHRDFDFIIGSTHSSRRMDPYYASFFDGVDADKAFRKYYADALDNVRTFHDFDSYGHLDYILRYGRAPADGTWIHREDASPASRAEIREAERKGWITSSAGGSGKRWQVNMESPIIRRDATYYYEKYADLIDPILFELILHGIALEVNTSSLRKGFPEPNPGRAIIRKYHDFGGRLITVGADAHDPGGVAWGFDTAAALLKECGFTQYATFEERRPVMHDL